jgi:hypothetical protein
MQFDLRQRSGLAKARELAAAQSPSAPPRSTVAKK